MDVQKQLIFGLGPGRCGTVSLRELLNLQINVCVTHECFPLLPWDFSQKKIDSKLEQLRHYGGSVAGDVAFYYLPYVEYIINQDSGAKFICLKRKKSEVVNSYLRKTFSQNPWMRHDGCKWHHSDWDACYPKFKACSKREAIELFWDFYYEKMDSLKKQYPRNILLIDMREALNSIEGRKKVLVFIGIAQEEMVLVKLKKNVSVSLLDPREIMRKIFYSSFLLRKRSQVYGKFIDFFK